MMGEFGTLLGEGRSHLVVKRSRFLGAASPVRDQEEAEHALASEAQREAGASHVAFAYRVGKDSGVVVERYSDAGEPQGTAGPPLLEILRGEDLDCCLLTVVRHYGGINLGTGGLARAYQDAGKMAIDTAARGTRVLCRHFTLRVPYGMFGTLSAHLPARGWLLSGTSFLQHVEIGVWVPEVEVGSFQSYLGQVGGSSIDVGDDGPGYLARSDGGLEGDNCWIL